MPRGVCLLKSFKLNHLASLARKNLCQQVGSIVHPRYAQNVTVHFEIACLFVFFYVDNPASEHCGRQENSARQTKTHMHALSRLQFILFKYQTTCQVVWRFSRESKQKLPDSQPSSLQFNSSGSLQQGRVAPRRSARSLFLYLHI